MKVHIFKTEHVYNLALLEFLSKNFDLSDVYEYRLRYRSFKHFPYHLARKKIIRMIPYIAGYLESFQAMSRCRNEKITVICPLSYGSKRKSYVKKVLKKVYSIFGSGFKPLHEFLHSEKYLEILNNSIVEVINHDRQQGLGNTLSLLYPGKKVFLRSETRSFGYFTEKNIKVFNISQIAKMWLEEFVSKSSEDRQKNVEILNREF